ncbi:MAG: hypothetical protein IT184_17865 [Acidobacteria bacterium]|nr:hypothetical protein [Acidobacteriota bacterium]
MSADARRSLFRALAGVLLVVEGLSSAFRFARFVSIAAIYPPVAIALLVGRALVGAALLTSGVWLVQGRPAATVLARAALLASASLAVAEIGWALAPTSIFPAYRWPVVALYWLYAVSMAVWIGRAAGERS